jgi:enoyl-CoA hydratase/carnithine racemase
LAIATQERGHIRILTIDRPEVRNALDAKHAAQISEYIDRWESDSDVWAVIVTGAGDQAFSAGMDLKARHEANRSGLDAKESRGSGFAGLTGRSFAKPLIAAVNGVALGGGFELCLACDMVVAEEHARFALPEVKRGLFAGAGGVERLVRRIPLPLAAEYILTGDAMDAGRALQLGLVNQVVPKGQAVDAAVALAERVCKSSPLAVRVSKRVMRASVEIGQAEVDQVVLEAIKEVTTSVDMREGVAAFVEKRPPVWTGR